MATTSIWPVKGYLGSVLTYAQNPDKTSNPEFSAADIMTDVGAQGLSDVMAYTTNPSKTEQQLFVSGVNCDPATARADMMAIKRGYNKEGGIVAWHGYQSFKPGEVTPEVAHEVGVKWAQRHWGDRFQVVVATHLDRGHLHNHVVVNSVSCVDGMRYHWNNVEYCKLREDSDALCREYGLSVIERPQSGRSKHYAEWQADRDGKPTWRSVIEGDIDECVARARTERQFFENLDALGYEYKIGADISVRPPGKERFFRLARNFGDNYTVEAIRAQIREGSRRHQILPVPTRRHPNFTPPKKLPLFARGSLVALHRHYLYLLGYYQQRGNPATNARMHYLLREDIRKLDAYIDDTRLLGRENIESAKQLNAFKADREAKIDDLTQERKELRQELRTAASPGNSYSTKDDPRYQEINIQLKTLRKEVRQCSRIEERSQTLAARIERIERDEEDRLSPKRTREEARSNGRNRAGNRPDSPDNAYGR